MVGEPGSGRTTVIDRALDGLPHPVTRLCPADTVAVPHRLSSGAPAVLVVDDADLLPPDDLDALMDRVLGQPKFLIPVVFAARPDSRAAGKLISQPTIALRGLDGESARAVLALHCPGPISVQVAERLVAATGANPAALRHLASSLGADELTGQRPLRYPPDIGPRLMGSYAASVGAMDEAYRTARLAAAAGWGIGGVDALLEQPLLHFAVYHSVSATERARAHEVLAAACRRTGDIESEAWHLLHSVDAPSREAAERVLAAAERARSRNRLVDAAELYAGAARLSGPTQERADRSLSAVSCWLAVGRTAAAAATVEEMLEGGMTAGIRSRAGWLRGRTLLVSGRDLEGRGYLSELAATVGGTDPGWAARMAAAVSSSALRSGRFEEAARAAEPALGWSGQADGATQMMASLVADSARLATGDRRGAGPLVAGIEEACRSGQLLFEDPMVAVGGPLAMIWSEHHAAAERVLDRFEDTARQADAHGALAAVLTVRALLRHRTGDPSSAAEAGQEAWELATVTAQPTIAVIVTAILAVAEAVLGRADRCRIRCSRLLEQTSAPPAIRASALAALGLLELGEGRPAEAIRWLEVLAATPDSAARSDPGFMLWRADLVDAYRASGETDRAWAVLADLERSSDGAGKGRANAAVKRCRAALCDDENAEDLYREAIKAYEGPEWRFARARAQLGLGDHLHRRGDRPGAEAALAEAQSLFHEIGAAGWERQALQAMDRLGLHHDPLAPSLTLSPTEHQVAMAASLGAAPGDISAALALPEAEVARHLDSALDKLGVPATGLAEIAAELAARSPAAPATGSLQPSRPPTPEAAVPTGLIRLLGEFEVAVAGATDSCPTGSVGVAVKIVALVGRLPAEELISELWPEADADTGRNRLRTLLSRVRQRCGPILTRAGDRIALAPGIETDARLFETAALAATAAKAADDRRWGQLAREALHLYRGELLPGDREISRAVGLRERLRRRHLEIVYLVAQGRASEGDADGAVALLEDAIVANRHDEGPYLRAASILAEADRGVEALSILRRARSALAEIGLPLSPAGQKIEDSILGDRR